ncbi:LeuA family protein [Acidobacteriia bacterium AH_259_A11_L15]|nr:LeuA family protein [Acidobacteriia bacterium AH_259_A11_L15]
MNYDELIYDWNAEGGLELPPGRPYMLDDESLRDGLQSPSVRDPSIEDKIELLHLMDELGIDSVDLGLPGAGARAVADVERLAREIVNSRLKIRPNCAARTHENDIRPIAEISQRVGIAIETATFLGSSPIRRYAEDWTVDFLLRTTEKSVTYARKLGLPVMYVTEDTTRCDPETVKKLYTTALNSGAEAIVVCDTVGHVTPRGVRNLIRFILEEVVKPSGRKIRVDWHGHRDRGLAVANSLAAYQAGADQVHGCALALGERVGNTPIDLMLVNLKLYGVIDRDLTKLRDYCRKVSQATGVPIPPNYPVMGSDAFRTATGVHAAAVIKAYKKNDVKLANTVYSGVPSHYFGLDQVIEIGPMSGKSNVTYWLEQRGLTPTEELVERILQAAKLSNHLLTEDEVLVLCRTPSEVKGPR